MANPLRRYMAFTVLAAIGLTAVQAALIALLVRAYQMALNRRVGESQLATQALILREELSAHRTWPEIDRRLREALRDVAADDEMVVYDASGRLLARSSGLLAETPETLDARIRADLDQGDVEAIESLTRKGVVAAGAAWQIAGQKLYLLRLNRSFRSAAPSLLRLGVGALMLPMLLVGLGGGVVILRLTGRQIAKVDRVLQRMASGDLSARMSLPVDPDTAGAVLSFNRMAERVEDTVQKLRRSDEIRRQLLADVTHELNTPLTSVLGYLETLCMDDLPLSEERRRSLTHIAYEEAVNLRALIEDLTTLSRLDAEGLPLEWARVALGPVAEKVVRRLTHLAETRGVPVTCELESDVEVRGDRQRLDQVIRNLIENAVRHTAPPGDVRVVVRRGSDGASAVLEVRDRGTGMAPEDLERIGQRFFRPDRSRARHTGGRGLGLAITMGLVEAHGGKVQVESELGKGTTVRVSLPALSRDQDAGGVAPDEPERSDSARTSSTGTARSVAAKALANGSESCVLSTRTKPFGVLEEQA